MRIQSQLFAEHVALQATDSPSDPLYTGAYLKEIAEYLNSPFKTASTTQVYRPRIDRPVAHIYDLTNPRARPRCFSNASDFESACDNDEIASRATLIFLTGHSSPEWINAIGGELDIDHSHLIEHLNFRPTIRLNALGFPNLPSLSRKVIRLTVPTIGYVEPARSRLRGGELKDLRRECASKLREHLKTRSWTLSAGSPILRRFAVLSPSTFVLEQDITISLIQKDTGWTLLIWCDCSGDGEGPDIPLEEMSGFERSSFVLEPVVQIRRRRRQDTSLNNTGRRFSPHAEQSLAMLPGNYGQMLDPSLAARDPFYALYELFDFVAAAEWHFVKLIWTQIHEQEDVWSGEDLFDSPSLADIQALLTLLEHHATNLRRVLDVFQHADQLDWPVCADASLAAQASQQRAELVEDFTGLFEHINGLIKKCEHGKEVMLGNASLLIARQSFSHDLTLSRITSLGTWIAILYGPVSLVTAVFGMNFSELGQGHLSIWLWGEVIACVLTMYVFALLIWKRAWVREQLIKWL